MAASADPKQLSPKVIGVAIAGFVITALGAAMVGVTPETLEALGPWAFPAASFITTLGGAALAWWRTDPLRQNYLANKQADEADFQYKVESRFDGNAG